jgi:N,N'-diacetyllegionaminate synthase
MNSHGIYIIAEMACSHEGDRSLARKIIDGAGNAGSDAIQFQIWSLIDMVVPHHPDYKRLKRIELTREEWSDLATYTREQHPTMKIVACVYEHGTVDFCEKINIDAYKLHSADLSNPSLIKYLSQTNKRIDLCVGASTIDEIQKAVEWIRGFSNAEIWLMYGYQSFPTPTDGLNLDFMIKLRDLFNLPVGYQDHSAADSEAAYWIPAAAVGMGVDIIEKHITHDRSFKGIDHEAALNPAEFSRFVSMVREIEKAKGLSIPRPFSKEELEYRKYSKKSLVAAHDLKIGKQISENDLLVMRAESLGLPPDQVHRLVGRTTIRNIKAFHSVLEDDVS